MNTPTDGHEPENGIRPHEPEAQNPVEPAIPALKTTPADDFNIFTTVIALREARYVELMAAQEHTSRRASGTAIEQQIKVREAFLMARGYSEGKIEGKNADLRKAAEAEYMAGLEDNLLKAHQAALEANIAEQLQAADSYEKAKIERRYWEDLFASQQAVLYQRGAQVINVGNVAG